MNLKKLLINLIVMVMFAVFVLTQGAVYAATGTTVYMQPIPLMDKNVPAMGYAIGNPISGGKKIFNIVQYASESAQQHIRDKNIYCLKSGVGFTEAGSNDELKRKPYNVYFDMKKEREEIKGQNDLLKTLVVGTIPDSKNNKTISQYNAILAVLDKLYLPGQSVELEKKQLIDTILQEVAYQPTKYESLGVDAEDMMIAFDENYDIYNSNNNLNDISLTKYALTDNDIQAVQQAVIWYFTNYYKRDTSATNTYKELSDHDDKYDKINKVNWLNYTENGNDYDVLANFNPDGEDIHWSTGKIRNDQATVLYTYMIEQAKEKAEQYANTSSATGSPIKIDTESLLLNEISGDNYIIGPIHMTELNSNSYGLDFVVKNEEANISNYKLLNEDKKPVANGTTVKSLVGKDFYISVPKNQANNLSIDITINYNEKTMTLWASTTNNLEQPLVEVNKKDSKLEKTLVFKEDKPFDLALRKYITKINGTESELTGDNSRIPNIDESMLTNGKTTAAYKHKKDPVEINTGDTVTYKMTIYNEGEKAGRATEVIDQLPTGLEFSSVVSGNFDKKSYDATTNTLVLERKAGNTTNLPAYQPGNLVNNGAGSETIEIECKVTEKPDATNRKVLTNVAWISKAIDEDNTEIVKEGQDRDSLPANKPEVNKDNMSNYTGHADNKTEDLADRNYHYKGQEDDDDFEKLVLLPKAFDLKLVKHISAVNGDESKGKTITNIDTSKLASTQKTTPEYELDKNAVKVKVGDYVTYTFSVYNEGDIDGYVTKLTDNIPLGLQFVQAKEDGKTITIYSYNEQDGLTSEDVEVDKETYDLVNKNNAFWGIDSAEEGQGVKIDTYDGDRTPSISLKVEDYLGGTNKLLNAYDKEKDVNYDGTGLSSVDVTVVYRVSEVAPQEKEMRNEAAITGHSDKDGNDIIDRDSKPEEWPGKDDHNNYEDDEDYDKVIIESQVFDLALRKFIVAVSDDTKIDKNEELRNADGLYTRAPEVDTSKLNTIGEDGKLITTATYNHTKEPIIVKPNDIVVYMLRVYNEGDVNGYASEIKDHLPPHLEFVEGEYNKQYGWEISEDGRTATTRYLENARIDKAEALDAIPEAESGDRYVLSYKEVPIMCRVKEEAKTSEKITNIADITEYLDEDKKPATDRDSQPDNVKLPEDKDLPVYKDDETGSYIPGQQDDDDFEKVIVKIFDLALRKWVTQAIVIEDGGQTITQTGHDAWDDPEAVVKVELHRKKLNQVTVKFKYSIRVYNQGEIAGYAKEVTDYIPEGLKFVAEDNPGWTDEGNNVISTRLLENTLLQPGEFADVEVLLTWINSENNMGVMINTAEISEDYNEYDVPDIDSTPDNKKPGEDDIDDAPVMLSISTGQVRIYFTLGFIVLITVAGGVVLIKKFVI